MVTAEVLDGQMQFNVIPRTYLIRSINNNYAKILSRCLHLLRHYNREIEIVVVTLEVASYSIFSFLLLALYLLIVWALVMWLSAGGRVEEFAKFGSSIFNSFTAVTRNYD